ncbi:hypothetical protein [Methylotenera sp. N17]|uniref:hypothetical protein n=1 Tax=Methylotenera sp. N17 TaxID=1502761 RepID=UPI000645EE02|nr:hypothetical protein [Methylotenera sp. N17]
MANQAIIDWFLKKKKSGGEITPEVIELLTTGLEPRSRGRQKYKRIHLMYFALNYSCSAELIAEYFYKGVGSVRSLITRAKKEGWEVIDIRNATDKNGKKLSYKNGRFEKGETREVWIDNGEILHYVYFKLDFSGRLLVDMRTQKFA